MKCRRAAYEIGIGTVNELRSIETVLMSDEDKLIYFLVDILIQGTSFDLFFCVLIERVAVILNSIKQLFHSAKISNFAAALFFQPYVYVHTFVFAS